MHTRQTASRCEGSEQSCEGNFKYMIMRKARKGIRQGAIAPFWWRSPLFKRKSQTYRRSQQNPDCGRSQQKGRSTLAIAGKNIRPAYRLFPQGYRQVAGGVGAGSQTTLFFARHLYGFKHGRTSVVPKYSCVRWPLKIRRFMYMIPKALKMLRRPDEV